MSRYGERWPLFLLGAYRHLSTADSTCRCGRAATHVAAAINRGEVLLMPVCTTHAELVDTLPVVSTPRNRRESVECHS